MRFECYTQEGCRNCPPVLEWLDENAPGYERIDCGTDEGMDRARKNGVMSTPTVIAYHDDGAVACRASTRQALETMARLGALDDGQRPLQ